MAEINETNEIMRIAEQVSDYINIDAFASRMVKRNRLNTYYSDNTGDDHTIYRSETNIYDIPNLPNRRPETGVYDLRETIERLHREHPWLIEQRRQEEMRNRASRIRRIINESAEEPKSKSKPKPVQQTQPEKLIKKRKIII